MVFGLEFGWEVRFRFSLLLSLHTLLSLPKLTSPLSPLLSPAPLAPRYLATAGQDAIVRIYRTLSSDVLPEESTTNLNAGAGQGQNGGNAANVLEETPFRVWEGHKDGVLSLSWSKNGFLLTSSMDKVSCWEPEGRGTTRRVDFVSLSSFLGFLAARADFHLSCSFLRPLDCGIRRGKTA